MLKKFKVERKHQNLTDLDEAFQQDGLWKNLWKM